jgi:hypothetical protein
MRLLVRTRLFGAPAGEDRLAARHYRGRDCAVAATSRTRQMLLHGRDHPADITAVGAGNLAPVPRRDQRLTEPSGMGRSSRERSGL